MTAVLMLLCHSSTRLEMVARHASSKLPFKRNAMKSLACVVLAYTAVMLLIHVSTGKLFKEWDRPAESWIKRHFSARRALRVEALYWLLALAGWSLWPSLGWKALVVVFAVIHLGAWGASELHMLRLSVAGGSSAQTCKANNFIIAFDLVEAGALVALGWLAVLYLLHT